MIEVKQNILSESHRLKLVAWITTNEHLLKFNTTTESSDTDRDAFAVTFDDETLPEWLNFFRETGTNIYNFVGIVTYVSGDIPEHIDEDFKCYLDGTDLPKYLIKEPHTTTVYYAQIDTNMIGGDTIIDSRAYKAMQNTTLSFPSNTPHSVTSMKSNGSPRVVLVCEKYKLMRLCINRLEFPIYRSG